MCVYMFLKEVCLSMQYLFDEKYYKTVIVKYYNNLNFQIVLSN